VEVDAKTAAAIKRGIDAAEEVRKLVAQWTSKSSTPSRR
jgi:hypothetical protein